MNKEQKIERYEKFVKNIRNLLYDVTHPVAMMSTINCVLHQGMDYYFWTGFYLVHKPGELIVGPYQGTLGCLFIPFGKGVCGTCAEKQEPIIVPDVHQFPGHIACDSRSNSEIVMPVWNADDQLIAVFDVDSTEFNAFDEVDQHYLEQILSIFRKVK
jgi:GAF domain-containing protein